MYIQCYKFPSKFCFCCNLCILVNCALSFSLCLKYLLQCSGLNPCLLGKCSAIEQPLPPNPSLFCVETSSLTHMLFRSLLFNLQIFGDFPAIVLLLIANLISLWSESMLCMMSILLNLLRHVLWPKMWSILVNVPHELGKNVYSVLLDGVVYKCQLDTVD